MMLRPLFQMVTIMYLLYALGLLVAMNYLLIIGGVCWLYYRQTCLPKTGD